MRSSVVPHTIARETPQKTNWKNHFASIVASERPMIGNACWGSPKARSKKPSVPMTWPRPPPKAKANPTAQYMIPAIEKFVTIFAITVPAFLPREKPISRNAKPACMNITRQPAMITHSELIATESGRTPLLAASRVSGGPPRGNQGARHEPQQGPPGQPRTSQDNNLLGRKGARRSVGGGRPGVFGQRSKHRPGGFSLGSIRPQRAAFQAA